MRSPGAGVLVGLVVVVAASAGGVVLARHGIAEVPHGAALPSAPTQPSLVTGRLIHLDPSGSGSPTFRPLQQQPSGRQTLRAQGAFNALVQDASKFTPMPATVRAYYGRLTDPNATPVAHGAYVWGFAVVGGCATVGGVPLRDAATPSATPPQRCRQWEFVDARTGRGLGVVEQEVLPD